jgi:ABC-type Fe3+ transport system permease subunit
MLADMQKGPFAPLVRALGVGEWSWATEAWSARLMVLVGDTWQWTPFIFIVLLAAIENQPRDQVEAAHLDGASGFQIFRDITWPAIAPSAATVVLIRLIEAFKIVDLPNVLTGGGPGLATDSMTLHSFISWRTQDLGSSAAVGYMLLFVSTVVCVSSSTSSCGRRVGSNDERRAPDPDPAAFRARNPWQARAGSGVRHLRRAVHLGRWWSSCRSLGACDLVSNCPTHVDNSPFTAVRGLRAVRCTHGLHAAQNNTMGPYLTRS